MTRAAYFDCFSGASGNMLLGSLVDVGIPADQLRSGLEHLPVPGWSLEIAEQTKIGLRGTYLHVQLEDRPQPPRVLTEITSLIRSASLPRDVQDAACTVFQTLAQAEARVHGTSPDQVHFHEVGAVDAIVDIVGVVLGLHLLGVLPSSVFSSGLPLGNGWVRGEHGALPVPGPATAELLRQAQAPTRPSPAPGEQAIGELTTPTGAALVTTLASFSEPVFQHVEHVGYGLGKRDLPWPNAVRLWVGEIAAESTGGQPNRDDVVLIETNLDDSTPEQLGYAMERLMSAGALDVTFSPLQMKKNRPGVLVSVLAQPAGAQELAQLLLAETSAFGVRFQRLERMVAVRSQRQVQTTWGAVSVKEKHLADRIVAAPEYEDCARLARAAGVPLSLVYEAALAAAR